MTATIIQFKPKPTDDEGPPSQRVIDHELWDAAWDDFQAI
jgi:hypothetical protein